MSGTGLRDLRLVAAVGLAAGLTWTLCQTLGLASAAPYGVVIAAVLMRPDFEPWPKPALVLLPLVVTVGLSLGTFLKPLLEAPEVWQFAVVTAIAQCLGQALPDRLMLVRNLLAVLAVLPLLGGNATWLSAWHQLLAVLVGLVTATLVQSALRLPLDSPAAGAGPEAPAAAAAPAPSARQEASAAPSPGALVPAESRTSSSPQPATQDPEALPTRSLTQRFADPFFWRKLATSTLALSIGMGVGAVTPKYLYFGVVLLLNDSLGATLLRVRDRMVGVSLGVLMPMLVFNTFTINALSVALVMGGSTALVVGVGLKPQLRTALISSGVTYVGYGALTDWYVPHRWLDYLLGCGLALLVCLLVRPFSALQRFRQLARSGEGLTATLRALQPSALEEARVLGQEREFQELLRQLEPTRTT
ncbi:MAG: FUSC family protein [Synechococcaceae cyanobacterium]